VKEAVASEPVVPSAANAQKQSLPQTDLLPIEIGAGLLLQTKLSVGSPDDPLEKEADDTAERVMRMPDTSFIQRKCAHCENEEKVQKKELSSTDLKVQRQETTEETPQSPPPAPVPFHLMRPEELQLRPPLLTPITLYPGGTAVPSLTPPTSLPDATGGTPTGSIDWFAMNRPFSNRGVGQLTSSDASAIEAHWIYSFDFFRSIGATPSHAIFFTNMVVPMAIDSSLQRDYSTWWERTDRESGTSSKIFSPTLIRFDLHNIFGTIRPFWDPSNPYQIQRKSAKAEKGFATENTTNLINSSQGGGSPMPEQTKTFMENRFGYDFSDVRIHSGNDATTMSCDLNAQAFTVSNNIYFNQNKFSPDTAEGKQLLAHELTHTLQQGGTTVKKKPVSDNNSENTINRAQSFIQRKLQTQSLGTPSESKTATDSENQPKKRSNQATNFNNYFSAPTPPEDPHKSSAWLADQNIQRKLSVDYYNDTANSSDKQLKTGVTETPSKSPKIIQRNILGDAWDATGGRAVSAIGSAASTVYDAAGNAISSAIEWVEDQAESIINRIAPGLIDFLRGDIIQNIKDALASALDAATGGLFSQLQAEGLQGVLQEFIDSVIETLSGAVERGCNAFAILARKVLDFIRALGGAALQRIVSFFRRVGGLLSSFWNNFALPIWDAIKSFAGTVWDWITSTAAWLWDLIAPIRNAISRAWNWLMRQFGIAWKATGSVLDWLKGKAQQAWNWLMGVIEPIKTPLMIIGGVLLMLSPLGPIVAIGAGAYAIYRGVQWVRENWNSEVFVRFRNYLKEHVFDVISSAIESLKNSVVGAFSWFVNTLFSLQAPIVRLLENIGAMALFRLIRGGIQTFANLITRAVNWAGARIAEIGHHIINVARDIWEFLRPYAIIVAKLTILALNPWLLPPVLAAWAWRILPDCFKPPIIDFVIGIMISVLRAMPNFKMFGDAWPAAKQNIIEHLQIAYTSAEEEKIRMSNRIAEMVSELDLELISNQIEAVRQSPQYFDLELQAELLGINGTEALPFERTSAMLSDEPSTLAEPETDANALDLLSRSTYSSSHIEVDQVGTLHLEPEIQQQLLASPNGELIMDDQAHDGSRTVDAMLDDLISPEEESVPGSGTNADIAPGSGMSTTSAVEPARPLSREEMTEQQLAEMTRNSDESSATAACEETTQPDAGGQIPEELKIGPLTERQRAGYMRRQMWNSVKKWFRCNWHWVVPATILAIIALIALEILTGGTVTVAFEIIGAIMLGVSAVKAAMSIAQFGVNSLLGQISAAARNFANAMAVIMIELVMALTFGLGDTIKSTKNGLQSAWRISSGAGRAVGRGVARGARAVGRAGRALVRGELRQAGTILRTAARGYIRRGRLVMAGVGRRFGAGYKNLRQLTRALYERVRFRRFKLTHKGRTFQLWGEINPWVLMANGDIVFVEQDDLRVLGGNIDDTARLGDNVIVTSGSGRRSGTVIGVKRNPRQFVEELDPTFVSQNARRQQSAELRGLVNRQARRAVIEMRESTAELRRGISGIQPVNFQAHHVVPRELRSTFQDLFDRVIPPFNMEDGLRNGIMVPPDGAALADAIAANPALATHFGNSAFHLGSHPNYTLLMQRRLDQISRNLRAGNITASQAGTAIDHLIRDARAGIRNGGGTSINNIVF
jgi:phage-related protein